SDDDKEWQGEKRRGLEQGLYYVLSERARELSGQTQLATKSFAVELRVDGTLNKGEFRVPPVWVETERGHTLVTARPNEQFLKTSMPSAGPDAPVCDIEPTGDDSTVVRPRVTILYKVEVWHQGV